MTSCITQPKISPSLSNFTLKSCGFFILIDHLLSFSPQTSRQLKIAEDLLRNFPRTRISVQPPNKKAALCFINQMIDKALHIIQNPTDSHSDIQRYAANLLEAIQNFQQYPRSNTLFELFELRWNEFSSIYLKSKLCELMKKS